MSVTDEPVAGAAAAPLRAAAASPRPPASIETLSAPASFDDPDLRRRWLELLAASANLDKSFQTPAWFDHLRANPGARPPEPLPAALIVRRDGAGVIDGVVPLVQDRDALEFVVSRYTLRKVALRAAVVLGGQFLAAEDDATFDQILGAIDRWAHDCACITLPSVPTDSFMRRWVDRSPAVRARFIVYAPVDPGTGQIYATDFPASFDAYNAGLDGKRRANFKRKVRVLEKNGKPGRLRRFHQPADVAEFLQLARAIAQKSWQSGIGVDPFPAEVDWQAKLTDQARRGILRAFILDCGAEPAAFGVGIQADGIFQFRATGFDASLASLSPGTVLMYLMFGDLLSGADPVRRMSFGFGDTPYKRLFCNRGFDASRVLLMRKTPLNHALRHAHEGLRRLVEQAKQLYVRVRPPEDKPSAPAASDGNE